MGGFVANTDPMYLNFFLFFVLSSSILYLLRSVSIIFHRVFAAVIVIIVIINCFYRIGFIGRQNKRKPIRTHTHTRTRNTKCRFVCQFITKNFLFVLLFVDDCFVVNACMRVRVRAYQIVWAGT